MKRRHLTKLLAVNFVILIALLVSFVVASFKPARGATKEPIRIGLAIPLSGITASNGENAVAGVKVAFDEAGWQVAGRKIELMIEDNESSPSITVERVRKLVEGKQAKALLGFLNSGELFAVRDYIHANKIPTVPVFAAAQEFTDSKKSKYVFTVAAVYGGQIDRVVAQIMFERGHRKLVLWSSEFAAGRDYNKGLKTALEKLGGKVVEEIYTPVGTMDYFPYLGKISDKDVDAISVFVFGGDAIRFPKQSAELGLKSRIPFFGAETMLADDLLQAMGDSAIGWMSVNTYFADLGTPENKKFTRLYKSLSGGTLPTVYAAHGYDSAKIILEALKAVNGDIENTDKLIAAIEKVDFVGPRGPFRFDPRGIHSSVLDIYCTEVVKTDGRVQHKLIKTFKGTTRF